MRRWCALALVAACSSKSPQPSPPVAPVRSETPPPVETPPVETPPRSEVAEQAALAEQYDLGKRLYTDKKCASCHEASGAGNAKNPAVIGAGALPEQAPKAARLRKDVAFRTAADVLAFVKENMPLRSPGTLTDVEAAAITSWMLSESKVDITRTLDAANARGIPLRR
jgi:cytochrome c